MKKIINTVVMIAALLAGSMFPVTAQQEAVQLPVGGEVTLDLGESTLHLKHDGDTPTPTDEPSVTPSPSDTATPEATGTPSETLAPEDTATPTDTQAPTATETVGPSATSTSTGSPTSTAPPVTPTTPPTGNIQPFRNAAYCSDVGEQHDNSMWHGLWDYDRGCAYDHEHGAYPFTPDVAAFFPFNIRFEMGNVDIGHTNPSSPMENTHKHEGFKWQVDLTAPNVCEVGFEGSDIAVKAYAIQYHAFGPPSVEHEARNHSAMGAFAFCKDGNPNDIGYMYVVQLQEYGQRVTPYQGFILPYPNNPAQYFTERGPYITSGCAGPNIPMPPGMSQLGTTLATCRSSVAFVLSRNLDVDSIWSSKPTGNQPKPETPKLLRVLFRFRDLSQILDSTDLVHPFTWRYLCASDAARQVFNRFQVGCRWNNSTSTIHEVTGDIPEAWDGLAGFDTDPRPGRITARGFVTSFGDLNPECTAAGEGCYPIILVNAFVGNYSSELSAEKVSNTDEFNTPERDIYFCRDEVCGETDMGAVPSGFIGPEN